MALSALMCVALLLPASAQDAPASITPQNPTGTINLALGAGEEPLRQRVPVEALQQKGERCEDDFPPPGYYGAAPTIVLRTEGAVTISAAPADENDARDATAVGRRTVDLTLAVRTPNGEWICDDDGSGFLNPLVSIQADRTGNFEIWVGSYAPTNTPIAAVATVERLSLNSRTIRYSLDDLKESREETALAGGRQGAIGCSGYFTLSASLEIDVRPEDVNGAILALESPSAGIAVQSPFGLLHCSDDVEDDADAFVSLMINESGRYRIWLGASTPNVLRREPLSLRLYELNSSPVTLRAGFGAKSYPDPPTPLSNAAANDEHQYIECARIVRGEANVTEARPNVTIDYDWAGRRRPLIFRLVDEQPAENSSSRERRLYVWAPNGRCYDAEGVWTSDEEWRQAFIEFAEPMSGNYLVFGPSADTKIQVLEYLTPNPCLPPRYPDPGRAPPTGQEEPFEGVDPHGLGGGQRCAADVLGYAGWIRQGARPLADAVIPVQAGGNSDASAAIPSDALRSCAGYIDERASVKLDVPANTRFSLSVRAAADTTLVVHAPDDRWLCDDDGGSAFAPRLEITAGASAGVYAVFVGNYEAVRNPNPDARWQPAELLVSTATQQ